MAELEWPGSYCDEAETRPHYMVELKHNYPSSVFRCKLCSRIVILPNTEHGAIKLSDMMHKSGQVKGYREYLASATNTKELLDTVANLQELDRHERRQ